MLLLLLFGFRKGCTKWLIMQAHDSAMKGRSAQASLGCLCWTAYAACYEAWARLCPDSPRQVSNGKEVVIGSVMCDCGGVERFVRV